MNKIGFRPPFPNREIKEIRQGDIPYSLSRLEYLELYLNSLYSYDTWNVSNEIISLSFFAIRNQDTIQIFICHLPGASQELIDSTLQHGRDCVGNIIKRYNWDWVKIDHKIECLAI